MGTIEIPKEIPAETIVLTSPVEGMLTKARAYVISTVDQYTGAASQLKEIKAKAKELEEKRTGIVKPMNEAVKRVNEFFKAPLQFLTDAEAAIKKSMITYDNEQARLLREQQAKLQEEARKEQVRIAELAEKTAAQCEEKGDTWSAAEIRESVPVVSAPILADNKVKVAGISTRTTWSGEVTDKMALIKAVAEGNAPATLLEVNMPALNQMARALKGEMIYPGTKAVATQNIAA
jgi:hypothetical protein